MEKYRHDLLENIERITCEIAQLKKTIILEFRPSANGKNKAAWNNIQKAIKNLSSHWDNISAVEEIKQQRKKY